MRLTDEERRIADDVARHWWCILDSVDDAWARALAYITARRKALGEAEPPGTATAAGVQPKSRDARLDELAGPPDEEWSGPFCKPTESGTVTTAGVAAPTAEAVGEEILAWYVDGDGVNERHRAWDRRGDAETVAKAYDGTVVPLVRQGSQGGVVVTDEQREALVDVRRFFGQRSDFHSDPEERRHAQVISRHVGDLLAASDWPTVMPDGTTVSAAIDAAKGGAA